MKRRTVSVCICAMIMGTLSFSGNKIYAAENSIIGERENVKTEMFVYTSADAYDGKLPGENEAKGILTTKYRVSVNKATMRSGPGTNYSSLGTLNKNDVVWVRSISGGWAKFKVNSKWHYISEKCIKKATY